MNLLTWIIPIITITIIIAVIIAVMSGKQKPWSELSPQEKKQLKIFIIIGAILLVIEIITFFPF